MTDFNQREKSRSAGVPVFLYLFRHGEAASAIYAFTDAEQPIVFGNVTYLPVPITHSNIESSGKIEDKEFEVTVSRENPVAQLLSLYPSSWVVSLTIRQGHLRDAASPATDPPVTDLPVVWVGRIVERVGQQKGTVRLVGLASGASMRRPGLIRHWQYSCPLPLYGARCGADKNAATSTGVVDSVTGNRITFESGWQLTGTNPEDYVGGLLTWQGEVGPEYRMILDVISAGSTVVTTGPTGSLEYGDEVSITLGCPHTLEACGRLHDNIQNYGGHPFIPKFNPVNKNPFD